MHQKAFKNMVSKLSQQLSPNPYDWTWKMEHKYPFGENKSLRSYFNVGLYGVSGGRRLVNNLKYAYTDSIQMPVDAGPSTRRIIDFSNVEVVGGFFRLNISKMFFLDLLGNKILNNIEK